MEVKFNTIHKINDEYFILLNGSRGKCCTKCHFKNIMCPGIRCIETLDEAGYFAKVKVSANGNIQYQ